MKKCLAIAALLLASTAAQAQYTFRLWRPHHHASIPIAAPFRYPASMTIPARPNARAARTAIPIARASKAPQQAKTDPQAAPETSPAPLPHLLRPNRRRGASTPAPLPPLQLRLRGPNIDHDGGCRPRRYRAPLRLRPRLNRYRAASGNTCAGSYRRRSPPAPAPAPAPHRSGRQLAARRLADRGEGRQGPDRAMRRQSVRLFRRQEVEPEWRAGADQHEARQGQMERPDTRSEQRQHLRFHDRAERHRHLARSGLRLWRRVLRRPDLDAGQLSGCPLR